MEGSSGDGLPLAGGSEIVPLQDSGKEDDAMFVKYKRALDTSKVRNAASTSLRAGPS